MTYENSEEVPVKSADGSPEKGNRWKTGAWMVGSMLLGGVAVALWNRRMLTELQNNGPAMRRSVPEGGGFEDDDAAEE